MPVVLGALVEPIPGAAAARSQLDELAGDRSHRSFLRDVLAEDQEGLSAAFARSGTNKFEGVAWRPSPLGCPVLNGVCAWIDCEIEATHTGGDHLIVVGSVADLGCDSTRNPLLFHRGRYARTHP